MVGSTISSMSMAMKYNKPVDRTDLLQVLYILSVVCQIAGINRIGNPGTVIIPNKPAAMCLALDFLLQK